MSERFNAIAPKLSLLIRMLSSNGTGEIANAGRAIIKLLATVQLDIHALAERVERGDEETLTAAEMQRIYDKGFEDGFAKGAEHGRLAVIGAEPLADFAACLDEGVNGYSWKQIAAHCAANKHLFHGKALDFIEDMPAKLAAFHSPTPAQAKWLRDLFMRKFGGRVE
jgi:hypothetical protein